jgi:hypothetical protein
MGKKEQHKNCIKESVAQSIKSSESPADGLPLEEETSPGKVLRRLCNHEFEVTDAFVRSAVQILEQEHMLIVHNCLSDDEVRVLHDCYEDLHQQAGQAIRN